MKNLHQLLTNNISTSSVENHGHRHHSTIASAFPYVNFHAQQGSGHMETCVFKKEDEANTGTYWSWWGRSMRERRDMMQDGNRKEGGWVGGGVEGAHQGWNSVRRCSLLWKIAWSSVQGMCVYNERALNFK